MNSKLAAVNLNDPVTRHVRTDFTRLRGGQTVGQALAQLRSHPPGGRVIYLYVVNGEDRLEGVIPVRRLLLSPLETPLRDIMVTKIISIPASATVLDACEFFTMHRLLAFPVLESGKIVGVVDVELYTEELEHLERSERSDALFQLIGVHLKTDDPSDTYGFGERGFPLDPSTIRFSRPIYPYPIRTRYLGHGDPKEATSFGRAEP